MIRCFFSELTAWLPGRTPYIQVGMRKELFYNPRLMAERLALALERLAERSRSYRRRSRLHGTAAVALHPLHLDSMELLEALAALKPGVIYDIGANLGTWTLLAKAIFPNAEIHAFEPLALHHEAFLNRTKNLPGVQLHKIALGDRPGVATMRITNASDASSLLSLSPEGRKLWNLEESGRLEVPVKRLDDLVEETGAAFPSILKLDVQGFELNILKGSERCLAQAGAVISEVRFREFYEGQCLFHDVVAFLARHGFHLYSIGGRVAYGHPLLQSDALFVKRDALSLL